jgi:hypothetical protein
MTSIPATREGLDAFAKRGPGSASFARFMEETGRVELIEQELEEK